jgi:hypothetical protein
VELLRTFINLLGPLLRKEGAAVHSIEAELLFHFETGMQLTPQSCRTFNCYSLLRMDDI